MSAQAPSFEEQLADIIVTTVRAAIAPLQSRLAALEGKASGGAPSVGSRLRREVEGARSTARACLRRHLRVRRQLRARGARHPQRRDVARAARHVPHARERARRLEVGRQVGRRVTRAQALNFVDRVYADRRRAALSLLLAAPGEPDADAIDETFADFDREYEETRARLVAWLESLPDAQRPAHV